MTRSPHRVLWPFALVLVGALVASGATGALSTLSEPGLPDPGALTRVGLPAVQAVRDLAALLAVGVLVLAATCLPAGDGDSRVGMDAARRRAVALAQGSAATWLVCDLALVALVYSDASGARVGSPGFWEQSAFFASSLALSAFLLLVFPMMIELTTVSYKSNGPMTVTWIQI